MVGHIATNVYAAVIDGANVPVPIDNSIIVAGKHHYLHFHYEVQEGFIFVFRYHVIGKTLVVIFQALCYKSVKLLIEIGHALSKFCGLLLSPTGQEAVRNISATPISHLLRILVNIKHPDNLMVEFGK